MTAPIEIDRCCDCHRPFADDEPPGECLIHPGGAHHRLSCEGQVEMFQAATR